MAADKRKRGDGRRVQKATEKHPLEDLTPKQQKFIAGKATGKSDRQAALDAGYSDSTANQACRAILGSENVRRSFRDLLARRIPPDKLVDRLAEGLSAERTELAKFKGNITDSRDLVDFEQRRKYVELIARMQGLVPKDPEGEPDDEDSGPEEWSWPESESPSTTPTEKATP